MTTTRSRKAKGRRLQNWVRDSLRGLFLALTDDDVKVAIMGERGAMLNYQREQKMYSLMILNVRIQKDGKKFMMPMIRQVLMEMISRWCLLK